MKTKFLLLSFACCPTFLVAQAANTEASQQEVVKIVRVQGNAGAIANLAASSSGTHYQFSDALRAIAIRGKAADVASVERAIHELDAFNSSSQPASTNRDVEITAYVIGGSAEPIQGASEITGDALVPVVKQLRKIFPYSHYQLLSTILMRSAQDAKARTEGMMKSLTSTPEFSRPSTYTMNYDSASFLQDPTPAIHLANFHFDARVPYLMSSGSRKDNTYVTTQYESMSVAIQTDVDLREEQKVVVGKANVSDSDTCFFLVLTARVVR